MTAFRREDRILMRVPSGTWLAARILSTVVEPDARVAWVCPETEWQTARHQRRLPDGLPWPVADLRPYLPAQD